MGLKAKSRCGSRSLTPSAVVTAREADEADVDADRERLTTNGTLSHSPPGAHPTSGRWNMAKQPLQVVNLRGSYNMTNSKC